MTLDELAHEFDPSYLDGHYVLGRSLPAVPDGWRVARLEEWTLAHHDALPALDLVDVDGVQLGWILGHPIDAAAGEILTTTASVPVGAADLDFEQRFGDWLYTHGGRFAALLLRPRPLVYPDAYGLLPVLFRAETECLSSSLFLLPDGDGRLVEAPLAATLGVAAGRSELFPFATTPLRGVDAVVANHRLDLTTWRCRREWPTAAPEPLTVEEAAERVATAIEPSVVAAARAGNPRMGLTAGGDTRAVLACMRGIVDAFEFVTFAFEDDTSTTDLVWSPRIASRFGLNHRIVSRQPSTLRDARLYLYRTGAMNNEARGRFGGPTYAALGSPAPWVAAAAGEVLRASEVRTRKGWNRLRHGGADALTPPDILRFAAAPAELQARAEDWLCGLPQLTAADALQLLLIEMRNSCWYGTLTQAFPVRQPPIYPLTHRAVTAAALSTTLDDRLEDRVRTSVVAARWPELLEIPFNRAPLSVAAQRRLRRLRGYARAGVRRLGLRVGR